MEFCLYFFTKTSVNLEIFRQIYSQQNTGDRHILKLRCRWQTPTGAEIAGDRHPLAPRLQATDTHWHRDCRRQTPTGAEMQETYIHNEMHCYAVTTEKMAPVNRVQVLAEVFCLTFLFWEKHETTSPCR